MSEEERYSNRQIERLLDEQSRDIKEHIDTKTNPIIVQTTRTNGRVSNLEVWRGRILGGMAVITVLLPILVGVEAWMLLKIIDIPASVRQAVDEQFNNRVIKE